jgi:hypothetical protein
MICRACKLEHSPLVNCTVARRLADYHAKQIGAPALFVMPERVAPNAQKPAKALHLTDKPVTPNDRAKAFAKRKAEAGLIEVRGIWAHPDNHAKIKEFARDLK